MKSIKSYFLITVILVFVGSCSNDLSRSKAASELKNVKLTTQLINNESFEVINDELLIPISSINRDNCLFLEQLGYFKITGSNSIYVFVKPLDKLKKLLLKGESYSNENVCIIIGEITNVKINGIKVINEANREVNYSRGLELNEFGKVYFKGLKSILDKINSEAFLANFSKYDDGWRLEHIKYENSVDISR